MASLFGNATVEPTGTTDTAEWKGDWTSGYKWPRFVQFVQPSATYLVADAWRIQPGTDYHHWPQFKMLGNPLGPDAASGVPGERHMRESRIVFVFVDGHADPLRADEWTIDTGNPHRTLEWRGL